jgi:hypothetical protein
MGLRGTLTDGLFYLHPCQLEIIQNNIEDWDSNKGKGSGINYEYDCIKSFIETANF